MTANGTDRLFESIAERVLERRWDFYPNMASNLGLHQYDGRLPDISRAGLAGRACAIEEQLESLERIDVGSLSRQNGFDHKLLTLALRKEHFELTEMREFETNPMQSLWHIELSNYVKRGYAPIEQRVQALTQALQAVPLFLENLRNALSDHPARPVLEAAIEAYGGLASCYDKDLPEGARGLSDPRLGRRFEEAHRGASYSLSAFVDHLRKLEGQAVDDFAIGTDKFLALLKLGEMVDVPLERLLDVGTEDLAHNQERFRAVAAQIAPARSPAEVMAAISADHPAAESLIDETEGMLEDIRQFLIERDIVSVPSDVRCQTTETPSFMRWAFAAMGLPGPFEAVATEAYYYVTPVEENWSDQQKEEWLSSFNRASLRNISVHEAYPGHYVHHLHARRAPSTVSRAFGAYSFWEGWAHYAEEMMMEQGYGGGSPRFAIAQLGDALLRNCRYICATMMHTRGMTLEEATSFFMQNAFMEELPASKEALRGTFDPMYVNYTLGKLMIRKLRDDYRREKGSAFSLKRFHDVILSYGAPPIPLVREMMLGHSDEHVL